MREVASFVDKKMQAVRENFPGQPELTSAVIADLSIAEDLMEERSQREQQETTVHTEIGQMIEEIDEVVGAEQSNGHDEPSSRNSAGANEH